MRTSLLLIWALRPLVKKKDVRGVELELPSSSFLAASSEALQAFAELPEQARELAFEPGAFFRQRLGVREARHQRRRRRPALRRANDDTPPPQHGTPSDANRRQHVRKIFFRRSKKKQEDEEAMRF